MQPFFAHIFCYRGTLAIWKPVAFMCTKRSGSNRALEEDQVLKCWCRRKRFPHVVSMFYEDGWYKYIIVRNYDLFLKTCNKFNISAFCTSVQKLMALLSCAGFSKAPWGGLRLCKVRWSCFRLGNFDANTLPETNIFAPEKRPFQKETSIPTIHF